VAVDDFPAGTPGGIAPSTGAQRVPPGLVGREESEPKTDTTYCARADKGLYPFGDPASHQLLARACIAEQGRDTRLVRAAHPRGPQLARAAGHWVGSAVRSQYAAGTGDVQ
jgi:hypothetical protein